MSKQEVNWSRSLSYHGVVLRLPHIPTPPTHLHKSVVPNSSTFGHTNWQLTYLALRSSVPSTKSIVYIRIATLATSTLNGKIELTKPLNRPRKAIVKIAKNSCFFTCPTTTITGKNRNSHISVQLRHSQYFSQRIFFSDFHVELCFLRYCLPVFRGHCLLYGFSPKQ